MPRKLCVGLKQLRCVYWHMKGRCENPTNNRWSRYGGRGIKICDEWKYNRKAFDKWAWANGFKIGLTLDRIDNNGDYTPNNCRFVTHKENVKNSSLLKLTDDQVRDILSLKGKYTQRHIAKLYNVSATMINRILSGKRRNLGV